MQNETKKGKFKMSWFIFAVAVIVVYKLLDNFGEVTEWLGGFIKLLMPFIMAIILAYLFYLPCRKIETFFEKAKSKFIKKRARWLGIFVVYVIALVFIIVVVKFIVPTVYNSLMELASSLPDYYNSATEAIKALPEDSIVNKLNLTSVIENLGKINIAEFFSLEKLGEYVKGIIGFTGVIFDIFVTIVVSIYILAERKQIVEFAKKLCGAIFNTKAYKLIGKYFRESNAIFFRFISSQLLDAIVVGILTSIAMSILNVKYALLLGFMIGLFNLIPYLGAIVAVVISAIITIFTGGITQAIWMVVVVTILQQIDSNIINPKILGNSLKISPILIIFSVTVIGSYFGIIGMFLAVPFIAIIKLLLQDYIRFKEETRKLV